MMYGSILFVCAIVGVSGTSADSLNNSIANDTKILNPRIVGGIDAQRNEFPFIASYQKLSGEHLCGGTILTKDWVVTAAHCTVLTPSETKVVAGVLILGESHRDIQVVAVAEQIIHPYYPGGAQPAANDIALLHLAWSLRLTYAVQPISYLPTQNEDSYGYAWVAGWGYLSSSNPVTPSRLQQAQMLLLTLQQCAEDLYSIAGGYGPLNQNMICGRGAYTGSETICKGDSGSPLVQNGKLIGITSWTLEPCGIYKAPSVYTQVSKFLPFIRYYVPGV